MLNARIAERNEEYKALSLEIYELRAARDILRGENVCRGNHVWGQCPVSGPTLRPRLERTSGNMVERSPLSGEESLRRPVTLAS